MPRHPARNQRALDGEFAHAIFFADVEAIFDAVRNWPGRGPGYGQARGRSEIKDSKAFRR